MWAALLEMVPLYFVKRWRSPNQDAWQVDWVEILSADQETASHTRLWSSGNNTKKKQAQKGYDIFTNSKYSICCYITIHSKNKKQNQTKPNTRNNFKGRAFMNWSFCCRTQIFTTGSDQLLLAYKQSQPSHESFDLCQIFFSVVCTAPEAGTAAGLLAALELCKARKVRLQVRENPTDLRWILTEILNMAGKMKPYISLCNWLRAASSRHYFFVKLIFSVLHSTSLL